MEMKRIVCMLLSVLLLLSLAACAGGGETAPSAAPAPASEAPSGETAPAPASEAPSGETAPSEETAPAADLKLENAGLSLTIPGEYSAFVAAEAPADRDDGVLFTVSEKASLEAAPEAEGAGWLFSIRKLSEEQLRALLCADMSGCDPFAADGEGAYYALCHPTDVRIERAGEITDEDWAQWSALCEWANSVKAAFAAENGLAPETYSNASPAIDLARIAYGGEQDYTLTTLESGALAPNDVDPALFVEKLLKNVDYAYADAADTPDGEYLVLTLPEEGVRYDFFRTQPSFVREVRGDYETLYRVTANGSEFDSTSVMQAWYDALLAVAPAKGSADELVGTWAEKVAGRGTIEISAAGEGGYDVAIHWGNGAAQTYFWTMTAVPMGDAPILVYTDARHTIITFESEESSTEEVVYENGVGSFSLDENGELVWSDEVEQQGAETTFVRVS